MLIQTHNKIVEELKSTLLLQKQESVIESAELQSEIRKLKDALNDTNKQTDEGHIEQLNNLSKAHSKHIEKINAIHNKQLDDLTITFEQRISVNNDEMTKLKQLHEKELYDLNTTFEQRMSNTDQLHKKEISLGDHSEELNQLHSENNKLTDEIAKLNAQLKQQMQRFISERAMLGKQIRQLKAKNKSKHT